MNDNNMQTLWLVSTTDPGYLDGEPKPLERVGMVTLPAKLITDVERNTYPRPYLRIVTQGAGSFYAEESPGERARLLRIIAECEIEALNEESEA
jgi:hypothetical protein